MKKTFLVLLLVAASLSLLAIRNAQSSSGLQEQQREQILEGIKSSAVVQITSDNVQNAPLYIQIANAKEISGDDFQKLTGEASKHTSRVTFPDVVLLNTSGKTIRSFAIAVKSAVDTPNSGYILLKKNLKIVPGESHRINSSEWPKAESVSMQKEGKFVSILRQPELDSPKSWLPGAASDLRVIIGMAEFEDGVSWMTPASAGW